jgi:hypothetical protein
MKLLINKKPFTLFTPFTTVTSFTPFTLKKQEKVNEGKRTPITVISCQPCGLEGKVNGVNDVTIKRAIGEILGKRPKMTPFTAGETISNFQKNSRFGYDYPSKSFGGLPPLPAWDSWQGSQGGQVPGCLTPGLAWKMTNESGKY